MNTIGKLAIFLFAIPAENVSAQTPRKKPG
jgi:hypothetical protein